MRRAKEQQHVKAGVTAPRVRHSSLLQGRVRRWSAGGDETSRRRITSAAVAPENLNKARAAIRVVANIMDVVQCGGQEERVKQENENLIATGESEFHAISC